MQAFLALANASPPRLGHKVIRQASASRLFPTLLKWSPQSTVISIAESQSSVGISKSFPMLFACEVNALARVGVPASDFGPSQPREVSPWLARAKIWGQKSSMIWRFQLLGRGLLSLRDCSYWWRLRFYR